MFSPFPFSSSSDFVLVPSRCEKGHGRDSAVAGWQRTAPLESELNSFTSHLSRPRPMSLSRHQFFPSLFPACGTARARCGVVSRGHEPALPPPGRKFSTIRSPGSTRALFWGGAVSGGVPPRRRGNPCADFTRAAFNDRSPLDAPLEHPFRGLFPALARQRQILRLRPLFETLAKIYIVFLITISDFSKHSSRHLVFVFKTIIIAVLILQNLAYNCQIETSWRKQMTVSCCKSSEKSRKTTDRLIDFDGNVSAPERRSRRDCAHSPPFLRFLTSFRPSC